jgi:hypothetical protein
MDPVLAGQIQSLSRFGALSVTKLRVSSANTGSDYQTVINVTGRGWLVQIAAFGETSAENVKHRVTIDGGTATVIGLHISPFYGQAATTSGTGAKTMALLVPFNTSLKIESANSDGVASQFINSIVTYILTP